MRNSLFAAIAALLVLGVAACGSSSSDSGSGGSSASGPVAVDGSSTVFPFAQAAAESFQQQNSGARVTVGESGTGGGFEKFCAGETDISNASRPIDAAKEVPVCQKAGIKYSEILVANEPDRYYRPKYVGHKGWIGVNMEAAIDWAQAADLIHESYRMTAPKRLAVQV